MRRYFIYAGLTAVIGGFLISPPSARADFTLVQRATSTVGNVSTGVTSTLPSTPTAGNLLIVAISAYNGSTSTAAFTVADKAGNTWHLATTTCGGAPCSATTNVFSSLFYAYNITSTSSETIHVSSSINPTFLTIGVYEFSGALSATDPFDKVVSAANATASSTSGNLTTTSSPELFFSNISPWTAGTTVTAGNGFSIVDSIPTVAGTTQGLNTEAKSAGATTTASLFNLSGATPTPNILAVFKASPFSKAQTGVATEGAGTTVTCTFATAPSSTDLVVVGLGWFNGASTTVAVTSLKDGNNNAFTTTTAEGAFATTAGISSLGYLLSAPANASRTITATFGTASTVGKITCDDFKVAGGTATIDFTGHASTTGSTMKVPTVTVSGTDELLYNFSTDSSGITGAAGPWALNEGGTGGTGWSGAYALDVSVSTTTNLIGSGDYDSAAASFRLGALPTVDQEGYRFRNDNGSESSATWQVAQDATTTEPTGQNTRLRVLVNASGTPASSQYQLEYAKNGGNFKVVSSTATTLMPTFVTVGTVASGTGDVTPTIPAVQPNDIVFLAVGSQNQASSTPPTGGWTLLSSFAAGTGISTSTALDVFWIRATSTSIANPLVIDRGNATIAQVMVVRGATTTGNPYESFVITTSTGNVTGLTFNGTSTTNDKDLILTFVGDTYDNAGARYSLWTNPRLGSITEAFDGGTTGNNGVGMGMAYGGLATAGNFATTTATTSASSGSRGFSAIEIIVPPAAVPDIILSASSSIPAAAAATTTFQLSAPAGKSTADFAAGSISDDTNPLPSLSLTANQYTELEWDLMATSTATTADTFTFRVTKAGTVLDSYSVTPAWIIGAPSGDTTPPAPDPMAFASAPAAASTSSVSMTATTTSDDTTPVWYLFTYGSSCGADNGTGGTSSIYQTSTSYTDTDLRVNQCYAYTVKAEDSVSPTPNVGTASGASSTYTLANVPDAPTVSSPTTSTLTISNNANGNPANTRFAAQVTSTSPNDTGWNGFWVDSNGASSSDAVWMLNADINNPNIAAKGLRSNTQYTFTVKARNGDSIETAQSATSSGLTYPAAPGTPTYTDVTASTLTVNWNSTTGASYYEIERATSSNGTYLFISSTSALFYGDGGLAAASAFYYHIRGYNATGYGPYSASSSVTTAAGGAAPAAPSQDAPVANSQDNLTSPVFKMTATDPNGDNLQYKVTIYSNPGCTTVVPGAGGDESASQTGWSGQNASGSPGNYKEYTSGTQGTFTVSSALSANTKYYWLANAKDPEGSNSWSTASACTGFTTSYGYWTTDAGNWSISGNQLVVTPPSGSSIQLHATNQNQTDGVVEYKVKSSAVGASLPNFGAVARADSGANGYGIGGFVQKDAIAKEIGGGGTILASTSFAFNPDTFYEFRGSLSGTTLRSWVDGTNALSTNDSQLTGGGFIGLGSISPDGAATLTFDDFSWYTSTVITMNNLPAEGSWSVRDHTGTNIHCNTGSTWDAATYIGQIPIDYDATPAGGSVAVWANSVSCGGTPDQVYPSAAGRAIDIFGGDQYSYVPASTSTGPVGGAVSATSTITIGPTGAIGY